MYHNNGSLLMDLLQPVTTSESNSEIAKAGQSENVFVSFTHAKSEWQRGLSSKQPDLIQDIQDADIPTHYRMYRLAPNGSQPEVLYYGKVPRFLQVWLTLIICTFIISVTLCVIVRTKLWCRRLHCASNPDSIEMQRESPTPTPTITDESSVTSHHNFPKRTKPVFPRRSSGPFGDDALAYAQESYSFRTKPAPTDKIRYLRNFKE